jgi:DNA ligase (NAD+)
MKKSEAKKKIEQLKEEISYHNYKYYVENNPVISDYEFDLLLKQLEELESHFPDLVTPDSPTQRVGEQPVEGFETVEHKVPMLSLANTYTFDELREFDERIRKQVLDVDYIVEPKIDGAGVALVYKDGIFIRGATRGDGFRGDDISQNLKTIRSIPLRLHGDMLKNGEVRGEVYMTLSGFKKYNEEQIKRGEPVFANPRNAAAGCISFLLMIRSLRHMLNPFKPLNKQGSG